MIIQKGKAIIMSLNCYKPEGMLIGTEENREFLSSPSGIERAMASGKILEAMAVLCDGDMTLTVDLGCMRGVIPHSEAAYQPDGTPLKDIAVITRVGKAVWFRVISVEHDENGRPYAVLSRRAAQRECTMNYLMSLVEGDIVPARVTHLEHFGAFVDIGCGVVSLMSIDCISVSRICHPRDRFYVGMNISAVIKSMEFSSGGMLSRIFVSHKELLGTWQENADLFSAGQTVSGVVRSIEEYGIFVELTPNLAGLAEFRDDVSVGQSAAVYIKNIIPERMKIKLVLIDSYKEELPPVKMRYYIDCKTDTHIDCWRYSPRACPRVIETCFSQYGAVHI